MSDERKNTPAAADINAEAEKDVQNVLAELKAEAAQKAGDAVKTDNKMGSEEKEAPEAKDAAAADEETSEETQIISAAANLARESEVKEESKEGVRRQERRLHSTRTCDNIKSDLTSQQESSDPDAIRKQVS
jgi:lupus La protein